MRHTIFVTFAATAFAWPFANSGPIIDEAEFNAAYANVATSTERGVGSGVTERLAPSAPPPPQCNTNYNGVFGIAILQPQIKLVATPAPASPSLAGAKAPSSGLPIFPGLGKAGGIIQNQKDIQVMPSPSPSQVIPSVAAAPTIVVKPAMKADAKTVITGATLTLQSTRTHTETITLRRTVTGVKSSAADSNASAFLIAQIGDGQLQAPTAPALLSITRLNAPKPTVASGMPPDLSTAATGLKLSTIMPVSQIGDGQIQAPSPAATAAAKDKGLRARRDVGQGDDAKADGPDVQLTSCKKANTLQMTLKDGILVDSQKRTGYIASNYQFQFDGPPQSGSIYTAGWSVCSNGSLALGGSTQFYQCLSGNFYNLYDRWWADQCKPVTINSVMLQDC